MEEIQSRLEIIRLAVDLGDQAAVNHQVTHLRNLPTDTDLHAILDELERHNFHQALFAMREYQERRERGDDFFALQTPEPEPALRTDPQTPSQTEELFGLDAPEVHRDEGEEHILSVDEMLAMTRESVAPPRAYEPPPTEPVPAEDPAAEETASRPQENDADEMALFDLGAEEDLAVPSAPERTDAEPVAPVSTEAEEAGAPAASSVETYVSDTGLFDLDDRIRAAEEPHASPENNLVNEPAESRSAPSELFGSVLDETVAMPESVPPEETLLTGAEDHPHEAAGEQMDEEVFVALGGSSSREESEEESVLTDTTTPTADTAPEAPSLPDEYEPAPDEPRYEAFAYMGQKFRNMLHQFPQKIPYEEGVYIEAQRFIDRVSTEDYTESQVEAMIARYQELKAEGHLAEAAQVLIAAATTESTFAQFMLARELFKGEVLKPDHAEAFTQINRMAEEDYPEAICDLGQLYEHGIGIDKNKRHALLLYEEAAAMGIERARQHYERLRRANPIRNLTSLFSRK